MLMYICVYLLMRVGFCVCVCVQRSQGNGMFSYMINKCITNHNLNRNIKDKHSFKKNGDCWTSTAFIFLLSVPALCDSDLV